MVELVVVIAILGILAAIAVPRFANQKDSAQKAADKATARTIASAITMAIAEKDSAGNPTADEINSNLNNLTVAIVTTAPTAASSDWTVLYTVTGTLNGFDIYKGKVKITY